MTTIVVFNQYYYPIRLLLLGMKCLFENQDLLMFGLKLDSNFHPLEVVDRGSEKQR